MSTLSHWVAAALAATMLTHALPAIAQENMPSPLDPWSREAQTSLSKALLKHRPYGMPAEPEGVTDVVFAVGADGRLAQVSVLHSSGDTLLDRRAIAAVRSIKTRSPVPPGLADGRTAIARIIITSGDRKRAKGNANLVAHAATREGSGQLEQIADSSNLASRPARHLYRSTKLDQ